MSEMDSLPRKEKVMRDWKAKRRGRIYCAPACGGNCTYSAFLQAKREAKEACKRMANLDGGVWKPHVWENLGWHWSIAKGAVSIYPHGPRHYGACLGMSGPWGGNHWEYGSTPQAAVQRLIKYARATAEELAAALRLLGGL